MGWIMDDGQCEDEWKNEERNCDCHFGNREDDGEDDSMTGM